MLVDLIPGSLVRLFARPYVAGDSIEDGIRAATDLNEKGLGTTLDLLAEDVETEEQARDNLRIYMDLIDAISKSPGLHPSMAGGLGLSPTISLKPSSYTISPLDRSEKNDARGSRDALRQIVLKASGAGIPSTIDMESRHWTDFTLDIIKELFQEGADVGAVLQTRLERTRKDLDGIPPGMRVRLVIGIYREPQSVATQSKPEMKARLLEYAQVLFARGAHVEMATHDEATVRQFLTETVPNSGVGPDRFEVQMLYGVPREALVRDIQSGSLYEKDGVKPTVRLYVPFAISWDQATAYLRRRLSENPGVGVYVARNLVRGLFGRAK